MNATDLMVGDLVLLLGDTPARVDAIGDTEVYVYEKERGDWHVGYEHIKPIPLTAEILEKNGTRRDDSERVTTFFFDDGVQITHAVMKGDEIQILGQSIRNVHELQHALRLCGIEKEITI